MNEKGVYKIDEKRHKATLMVCQANGSPLFVDMESFIRRPDKNSANIARPDRTAKLLKEAMTHTDKRNSFPAKISSPRSFVGDLTPSSFDLSVMQAQR